MPREEEVLHLPLLVVLLLGLVVIVVVVVEILEGLSRFVWTASRVCILVMPMNFATLEHRDSIRRTNQESEWHQRKA